MKAIRPDAGGRTSPKQLVGSAKMTEMKTQLAAGDSAGRRRTHKPEAIRGQFINL